MDEISREIGLTSLLYGVTGGHGTHSDHDHEKEKTELVV